MFTCLVIPMSVGYITLIIIQIFNNMVCKGSINKTVNYVACIFQLASEFTYFKHAHNVCQLDNIFVYW